jgi:hypothetical protein
MTYAEPEWAKKPNAEWFLTEIKGGMEVQQHKLTQPTTIFGRATDMVHVPLQHESSSRQHARISFDIQGIPWLRDLKSTHGTKINKKELPPQAICKTESNSLKDGSRGVMLYPGDCIRFGASSRMYCLEGPPEFDRGAMKAKMQQAAQRKQQERTQTRDDEITTKRDESVSWGISMDDKDEDDEEGATSTNKTLPMDMQVPEKYRKTFDRLNTLKYKLSNLETEDGRIRRKGELSQGQEKQLQRNAERENALQLSIVQLEEVLYDKLYPEKSGKKKRESKSSYQNIRDEDDDDFFDRTKTEKDDILETEESEKTLIAKWEVLFQQQNQQQTNTLPQVRKSVSSLTQNLATLEANGDEEAFFVKNDLALANERLDKITGEQSDTISTMKEIEKLLKLVNPKIRTDRETGYIGEGPRPIEKKEVPIEASLQTMLPPPFRPPTKKRDVTIDSEQFTMPPPMIRGPAKTSRLVVAAVEERKNDQVMPPPMPPPKRKRIVGPSMLPPPTSAAPKSSSAKPQGTLAFLSSMTKVSSKSAEEKNPKEPKKVAQNPKKDEWRAPENQDGSGITKLNAKFAGRY